VFFLLRSGGLQLPARARSMLEVESGTNDPVAVFLTIMLAELIVSGGGMPGWELLGRLGQQAALGGALGVASGLGAVWLLNRIDMPGGLHPLFVVAGAVFIYALTSILGGSGLLAAYLAGLVLANRPVRAYPSIVAFHDAATWLAQIGMFLVLGLLVTPSTLLQYALPGLIVAAFLILVARPAMVFLCLAPFSFSRNEKLYFSWVGLRGAVSVFLAAIPTLVGVPHAEIFFNMAFFVVLVSLMVQGWTVNAPPAASGWRCAAPRPPSPASSSTSPARSARRWSAIRSAPKAWCSASPGCRAGRGSSWWCATTTCSAPRRRASCTPATTPISSCRPTASRASTGCSAAPRTSPGAWRRCSASSP
jgi:potassium/hydrogen antiporter